MKKQANNLELITKNSKGLVYVFTGEGKGKTSAAIGIAVRAIGAGMRVGWVGFYKQESWKSAEVEVLRRLGVEVYLMGKGFFFGTNNFDVKANSYNENVKTEGVKDRDVVVDISGDEQHKSAARQGIKKARELIQKVDVLIMDEVNNAVSDRLVDLTDLTDLISRRKKTHVIITGRKADRKVVEMADLVTEMKKVKHPYDLGEKAVKGLDW